MKTLLDFNLQELESLVVSLGEQKFRAKQLQQVLLDGKFEYESNNLPKSLLEKLANNGYIFQPLRILKKVVSKDKTVKYLYKLEDGNIIEGVLMTYKYGKTLCVSTQVGCKMNCAFCASGLSYVRDLSCGEILGQVVAVNKMLGGTLKDRKITNIVLMGSGEPLDNFDAVVKFLQEITNLKKEVNNRIKKIEEVAKKIYYRYDEMAVDVRYMAIIFKLNKLRFMQGQIVIEALTKYPTTKFNDPIMEMYKLEISSLEGMSFQNDWEYSKYFYEELYLMKIQIENY